MSAGYYRLPSFHGDTVYFSSEDDIWSVSLSGGTPRRLTTGLGQMLRTAVSPDGRWLAVTAHEETHWEAYVTPSAGGPLRRLTFLGADTVVRGFLPDGRVLISSNASQPFPHLIHLYAVPVDGGSPELINVGPARELSVAADGRRVIARNCRDLAEWKRYRGGTAGQIWVETGGVFERLDLPGNVDRPMWIGERLFFLGDFEGIANLYSCTAAGQDVRRHTHHDRYYVRGAYSDGQRAVYTSGADLFVWDQAGGSRAIPVEWHGPAAQTRRRFVSPGSFLDSCRLHPEGHSLAVSVRGKAFAFANWEGPVRRFGIPDGVRYRLVQWLRDGKTMVAVTDESGEERLQIFRDDGSTERLDALDLGRVVTMVACPAADLVALSNHRMEVLLIDLNSRTVAEVDRSRHSRTESVDWSADGSWLAYDFATSGETSVIRIHDVKNGRSIAVSRPEFRDFSPTFDPEGKYLIFLSHRSFNPVYDSQYFDLNFPRSVKPCLVTLRKDEPTPFLLRPPATSEPEGPADAGSKEDKPDKDVKAAAPVVIDFEGIEDRVLAFPVAEGIFSGAVAIKGRVLLRMSDVTGSLGVATRTPSESSLHVFDFKTLKIESVLSKVSWFAVSPDRSALVYRTGDRLRVVKTKDKIEKPSEDKPSRQSGWIDLGRLRVSVDPRSEWRQMFRDIWRLQREFFWSEDMSGIDWPEVYERYLPLMDRVSTRSEFSDLVWELQGELGTSHAYEWGGDYRRPPDTPLGLLGADFRFDGATGTYRIERIVRGDAWDSERTSPLLSPSLGVSEGDRLLAVNGITFDARTVPESALVHMAGLEVELTVAAADGSNVRPVVVKTLKADVPARYREWVERNRRRVHEASNGRVGYVHIPDMGPTGYAEFHRYYKVEAERAALIVDVRFNRGGHVSPLLLEKLSRKRIGYCVPRWGGPRPYPEESVLGPMVAITNEFAGSDGDMFSHGFKMMNLGPLVGTRTWGGVIGIWPRHQLADGSMTSQPEYSFWFRDVEWGIENYGTDPDIEVIIHPEDYASGRDTQLERAIDLILDAIRKADPRLPDFANRPRLPLPKLPR